MERERWSSRVGFILAAAGSAIGLGNIWKFPYLVGENGGAAFILIYLISVALVGLPVVMAEILMGREAQRNPVGTFRILSRTGSPWVIVGYMGILAGFIILSYYNIIAGWSFGYFIEALRGAFSSISSPDDAARHFQLLSGNPLWTTLFHAIFMTFSMIIVYFGVKKGIEKAAKIMMPILFLLIIILVIRGVTLVGSKEGINYLVKVDFGKINGRTCLLALGQAFFSLSLGMGVLMTYGSYMSKDEDLPSSALNIVLLDTLVAILAGFMIFPALFAMRQEPNQGVALIFYILPVVFNTIPGGYLFRIIFFLLLSLAALTSTISLLEVITSFAVDELKASRKKAVIIIGIIVFLLGIPSGFSFNVLKDFKIFGMSFFNLFDFIAANILLPTGGILIAIFVGWYLGKRKAVEYVSQGAKNFPVILANIWIFLVKYVAPILILIVFLSCIGII
ncbi:MAG: sodium-dependent transporter [Candidatus Neomarinimicrobiota bacterium]|nr:sodium-dependent transporter [Candidatus Neomarinimicrobiota bacterium]RKY50581.1 MAG: sodium-dependent transporter [Candidatus Neomarinimicrobiota bacterium]